MQRSLVRYIFEGLSRGKHNKYKIFATAFMVRLIIAYITFGSIDIVATVNNSLNAFRGGLFHNLPYFPVMPVFFWFGGVVNASTPLPLTFCYKIIPVIYDSMIAVMIYDVLRKIKPELAFKAGIFYSLCPVPVIINCMHGQWDSICLFYFILSFIVRDFYRDSFIKYFIFGIMFGFSFMVKPVTLIFLPLFIEPLICINDLGLKKYVKYQMFSLSGLVLICSVCLMLFRFYGYNTEALITRILNYSDGGIIIFGLPVNSLFARYSFLKSRFWIIPVIGGLSLFYHIFRLRTFNMILIIFALVVGVSGLAPQYLLWIVPFLIICGYFRFGALYNLIVTLFLIFYYMNPWVSPENWENMGTFAMLKCLKALMPSKMFIDEGLTEVVMTLGNHVIPYTCLTIALYVLVYAVYRKLKTLFYSDLQTNHHKLFFRIKPVYDRLVSGREAMKIRINKKLYITGNGYILFVINFWFIISIVYGLFRKMHFVTVENLATAIENKKKFYEVTMIKSHIITGNYVDAGLHDVFNIAFVIIAGALLWSVWIYKTSLVTSK